MCAQGVGLLVGVRCCEGCAPSSGAPSPQAEGGERYSPRRAPRGHTVYTRERRGWIIADARGASAGGWRHHPGDASAGRTSGRVWATPGDALIGAVSLSVSSRDGPAR